MRLIHITICNYPMWSAEKCVLFKWNPLLPMEINVRIMNLPNGKFCPHSHLITALNIHNHDEIAGNSLAPPFSPLLCYPKDPLSTVNHLSRANESIVTPSEFIETHVYVTKWKKNGFCSSTKSKCQKVLLLFEEPISLCHSDV